MIVAIQQLEHLPWIGYFNKMSQCDRFVILDHVQFKKNYFENRNKIKSFAGGLWITVPVLIKGRFGQSINEVGIDATKHWKKKYLKSIEQYYCKAPFYADIVKYILPAFDSESLKLGELNYDLIKRIAGYLEIGTSITLSSELDLAGTESTRMLVEICKKFDGDTYISGPDGRNYLEKSIFEANGIEIEYHDFVHPEYPQLHGAFVSHMSVIDAIANMGKGSAALVRDCYRINCVANGKR